MAAARTYFDKVWADHVVADLDGQSQLIHIDRLVLHDWTAGWIMPGFAKAGRKVANPDLVFTLVDHLIDTRPGRTRSQSNAATGTEIIETARKHITDYGLRFFDIGDRRQGIAHVVAPEAGIILPGMTLVCGDSHTCGNGGVGALAWGIGNSEAEHVLATQTLPQSRPRTMRVTFDGGLGKGVYAKDMILALIGKEGANGGIGYAMELAGSAIRSLPVEGRLTFCSMAIEFSARTGFVPPDDTTFEYLAGREFAPKGAAWDAAVRYWRGLLSEDGAHYDKEVHIDASALRPHVTWGTSPEHVLGIEGRVPDPAAAPNAEVRRQHEKALSYIRLTPGEPIAGVPVEAAFIGSCTNGRLSDLRVAAGILKGRKVAEGVQAVCIPGSASVKREAEAEGLDKIFKAAGFEWHESGCGLCADMGNKRFADQRVISTSNRNFEGRQGPQTRTHLASPATVAASAVTGRITDPRPMLG
ncbi:MAG: 3-isopropylmalate dehydratase large subunit [Hyphomicrobiaceae bacterium]